MYTSSYDTPIKTSINSLEGILIVVVDVELVLPCGLQVWQVAPLDVVVLRPGLVLAPRKYSLRLNVALQHLPAHFLIQDEYGHLGKKRRKATSKQLPCSYVAR